jgi:diaminopimelate epimerase
MLTAVMLSFAETPHAVWRGLLLKVKSQVNIETIAGLVKATVLTDGQVQVEMPTPKIIEKNLVVPVGEHIKIEVLYLNTGVPHVVKETDDWEQEYLFEMGNYLRHHDLFKNTNGANATFFEITGPSKIQSATYERGVESVTMACGTGVVAAAIAATLKNVKSPIEIDVPGGRLVVSIGDELSSAMLTGDARFICEGEIFPEALL